jgi:hypothetical protein
MPKYGGATERQTRRGAFLAQELNAAISKARAIATGHSR